MIAIDRRVIHQISSSPTPSAQVMSASSQPMIDYRGLKPLLVYRQEGGGRAPRLLPWNATESGQYPLPLFPFPSRLSSCERRVETPTPDIGPGLLVAEKATYISPYAAQSLVSTTKHLPHGSSVQEQQSQEESSIQETNPEDGFQIPRRSSSINPNGNQKRKRVNEASSPGRRTKAQDRHSLSSEHDDEQKSANAGHTSPSSSNPSSLKAPSFSPLTSRSSSSMDLRRSVPIDLPINLHESPWHYDPEAHHIAREALHLRLCRRFKANGASAGSKQKAPCDKAIPKPNCMSMASASEAPNATSLADGTDHAGYTSEVDEWGIRKICHF